MTSEHFRGISLCLALFSVGVSAEEIIRTPVTEPSVTETIVGSSVEQRAATWNLSVDEYARYRSFMEGVRGSFSVPTISPLEVLGIHAKTPEERRLYAERLVHLLHADTERVLAFQREVDAAWKRLYGHESMFDTVSLPADKIPTVSLSDKRLAVFVSTQCPACSAIMPRLLDLVSAENASGGLDLYVIDTLDAKAIRTWARTNGIDPALVQSRTITLNHGRSLFDRMGLRSVPLVFLRDGDQLVAAPGFGSETVQ
ncbi:MAG: TIGR03759 family integrating conjugative element protein [Candidatus Sedimenticola endophacoides]